MVDKDFINPYEAQQTAQAIRETAGAVKQVTKQLEDSEKVADALVKQLQAGSEVVDEMPARVLKWKVGLQKLSKEIGFVNEQVVDHSKHLIQLKQDYSKLSNTAKAWLSAIDYKNIFEGYKSGITQFRGIFLSSFVRMNTVAMKLAKNFTELGQQGFDGVTDHIRDMDEAIQQTARNVQSMVTKDFFQNSVKFQAKYRQELKNTKKELLYLDLENKEDMATYIQKSQQISLLERKLELVNKTIQQGHIVDEQTLLDAKQQLKQLRDHRQVLYDINKLQLALNEKLIPYMDRLDDCAQKLNQAKQGIGDIFTIIGIDLVGVEEALRKIDFRKMVAPIKTTISTTTMQFALGFKSIKEKGISSFKGIATSGLNIMTGLISNLTKLFVGFFSMITLGLLAAMGALLRQAIQRSQELASAFISAQESAGALRGQMANFSEIYQAFGGALGGSKASQLYQTMLKLRNVTVATAKQGQLLERHYAVSVTDSAGMLQNMRNIFGMTQATSNNMATITAQMAVQMGIQPQKIFTQLANLSGTVLKYFGGSTKQLYKTLIFANKLNLTMEDMASTAEGLMDIQGSIENSMQLQALTGKEIDIGQILRLQHTGKPEEAMALMMKQIGDSIDSASPVVIKKLQQLFGFDIGKLRSAKHEADILGVDLMTVLKDSGIQAESGVGDAAKGIVGDIKTSAYALQTPFQAVSRRIKNIIYEHYKGTIDYILDNSDMILGYFDKFVGFVSKFLDKFIQWIKQPQVRQGLSNIFKKAYQFAKSLYEKIVVPMFNMLSKVYEKGGFVGLLGLFALVKILLHLPSVITGISSAVGLFSAKAAAIPTMMTTVASKKGFQSWVDASGYSKQTYQKIKSNKGLQAAQKYKNKRQSVGQKAISQQGGSISKKAQQSFKSAQKLTQGTPAAPPSKFQSIAKSVLILAAAVGILAGAMWVIAQIPNDKILISLGVISALLIELVGVGHLIKQGVAQNLITLSVSVAILAGAMRIIANIPPDQILASALAIGGLTLVLAIASKWAGAGGSAGLLLIAAGTFVLALAIKQLVGIPFGKLMAAAGALAIFVVGITALAAGLQLAAPFIMVGVGVLLAMGAALIVFGKGMQEVTKVLTMGIKPADIKALGTIMAQFAKIVGTSMKDLVASLAGVGLKQAIVTKQMVKSFSELVGALKSLYEIAKQPGAIDNIKDALQKLADSGVGEKVGTIMKDLAQQLKDTKAKTAESINAMMGSFGELVGGLSKLKDLFSDPNNIPDFTSMLAGLTTPGEKGEKSVVESMSEIMDELIKIVDTKGKKVKVKTAQALKAVISSFSSVVDVLKKLQELKLVELKTNIKDFSQTIPLLTDAMISLVQSLRDKKKFDPKVVNDFSKALDTLSKAITNLNKSVITDTFKNSIKSIIDMLKANYTSMFNFAKSITAINDALKKLQKINTKNLKLMIEGALRLQAVKSIGLATQATAYSEVTEGMVKNLDKIVKGKFAEGGIVRTPQIALVGENGPEAIIPLQQFNNYKEIKVENNFMNLNGIVKAIQNVSNKPIQVILNVDGRKLAEVVANNTTPSYNLA